MQTLAEPHMALNSADFTERYQMWNSWNGISASVTRSHIVGWVSIVANNAPGGKLKNLVINSHGAPAWLGIGEGFSKNDLWMFKKWAGLIDRIWLNGCSVAYISPVADGNMFLYNMATYSKATIIASTETQYTTSGRLYPYGMIDNFEGLLLEYSPDTGVTWSKRYDSNYHGD